MKILTKETLHTAAKDLVELDSDFAEILERHGPAPLWQRTPGFETLLNIILGQQVSLASAQAAMDKLHQVLPKVTPQSFVTLDDQTLKMIGFSRQKASYVRGLAEAIKDATFDLNAVGSLSDAEAFQVLTAQRGIGPWTAGIYLLMALARPDVWPNGDRALAIAAKEVKNLEAVPSYETLEGMAEAWQPWRAVAARMLWHHYLNTPRKKP